MINTIESICIINKQTGKNVEIPENELGEPY